MARISLSERFDRYKSDVKRAKSHPAKEIIIFKFLEDIFGIRMEELAFRTEKNLRAKGFRGRADYLHTGVILEVKVDLKRELKTAEEELKNYLSAKAVEGENYIGIATDGLEWRSYILEKGELKEISVFKVNDNAEDFVVWLDAYFLTKRGVKPSAEDLQIKFGLESPTFREFLRDFRELFEEVKNKPHVSLKYDLWKRHLEVVYGRTPDLEEFLIHTYLVTLVKLIMFLRFHGMKRVEDIERVLNGSYFRDFGITNFIEEDFFTWILEEEIKEKSLNLIEKLLHGIEIYDFDKADEDLFKEIYQDIIGPSARHRIGEYYTPEWLARLTLLEALKFCDEETPKILDPACGSGTFLTNAISWYKEKFSNRDDLLELILTHVMGMDINPLAVIIAKANYLIALGDLLMRKKEEITVPIYLADSIKLPKAEKGKLLTSNPKTEIYEFHIDNKDRLFLPESLIANETLLNKVLKKMRELLLWFKLGETDENSIIDRFTEFLKKADLEDDTPILLATFTKIIKLIKQNRDTIWLFILRNIYAPVRFAKEKFDIVIGNPPWIALRYVENKEYQDYIKKLVFTYELLSKGDIKLFTHMEVATLFFMRCADLYLKERKIIAFVMPRSILTGAKHHAKFRELQKPPLKLLKIIDNHLETSFKVEPLFNVPSCVLIARKGIKNSWPVEAVALSYKSEKKNLKLEEIMKKIKMKKYDYEPPRINLEKSYYYKLFKEGASIVPRPLWFIDFVIDEKLGINPIKPKVKSSEDALKNAKGRWKNAKIEGNVEREFIYVTLLSRDLKPFGYDRLRPIVLPIKPSKDKFLVMDVSDLESQGAIGIASWLKEAQKLWDRMASEKDKKNFPRVINRLNYHSYLAIQDPSKRYVIITATSGSYTASCVIDKKKLDVVSDLELKSSNFIVETTTFYYETNHKLEAYYLSAIINSNTIDRLIKPLQAKGSFGERHIQRLIFEFPIPKFDPSDSRHLRLAELGEKCHEIVKTLDIRGRRKVKEALGEYMDEIDRMVSEILGV
ncbi:MAG: N-6 DNA methylase [Candidatus Njordarchaeia archaeon]